MGDVEHLIAEGVRLERARYAKISHLAEIGFECFSMPGLPTGREVEILQAVAAMIVHASSKSHDACCDPFNQNHSKLPCCLRCFDVRWLRFTGSNGWEDACPNCNQDDKKEPGEEP